jgi:hypothetical protein
MKLHGTQFTLQWIMILVAISGFILGCVAWFLRVQTFYPMENLIKDWTEERRYARKSRTQADELIHRDHGRSTRGAPMDTAALVEHQIDDVPKLIGQLKLDNFYVKAAFWLYTSEADQWFLYI